MALIIDVNGIYSVSLRGAWICCGGHEDAVCGIAVCNGGECGASELAGGGNALLTSVATSSTVWDGSGLVGSNAGQMNFLFLLYLSPELV